MLYCVQARLGFSTTARRTTLTTASTNNLAGKVRDTVKDEALNYSAQYRLGSTNCRRFSYFFTTEAHADSYWSSMATALTTTAPTAGSWIEQHACSDVEGQPCTVKRRTTF